MIIFHLTLHPLKLRNIFHLCCIFITTIAGENHYLWKTNSKRKRSSIIKEFIRFFGKD